MSKMLFNQLCSKCHLHVINIKVYSEKKVYSDYFYISLLFNVIMYYVYNIVMHLDPTSSAPQQAVSLLSC